MSYLALPCHEQTSNSIHILCCVYVWSWSDQTSQFMIIGCFNNSNVTIVPNQ